MNSMHIFLNKIIILCRICIVGSSREITSTIQVFQWLVLASKLDHKLDLQSGFQFSYENTLILGSLFFFFFFLFFFNFSAIHICLSITWIVKEKDGSNVVIFSYKKFIHSKNTNILGWVSPYDRPHRPIVYFLH